MACNCEENKYNINFGCCVPIVANADAYYTKSEIDEKIDEIVISGGGITSGEVQTMIDESIADKADKSEIPTVPTKVSSFENDVPYLTQHQSLSGYATEQWVEDKHYITGVDLSDYATEQWVQNQGYLTEHQSLSAYSTTKEVANMINQSVSGKQDSLSAGTGIDITNNVISATGGGTSYSASSGINITNNEISTKIGGGLRYAQDGTLEVNSTNAIASGNTQVPLSYVVHNYINNNCMLKSKIWCGTQQQFDAITTLDSETLYLIHS